MPLNLQLDSSVGMVMRSTHKLSSRVMMVFALNKKTRPDSGAPTAKAERKKISNWYNNLKKLLG